MQKNRSNDNNEVYVNKTFRLRTSSISRLETDADRLGISVNTLIQNSIQRFIEWDRYADAVQMTSFFPNMLDAVLEHTSTETIEKIGKQIFETSCFKDVCLLIFKRYDVDVFLKMVSLMDRFGNNYRMQSGEDNGAGELSMSLYHNYGKKWSIFVGTILHNELLRLKVQHTHEISDNTVVLKFPRSEAIQAGLAKTGHS